MNMFMNAFLISCGAIFGIATGIVGVLLIVSVLALIVDSLANIGDG